MTDARDRTEGGGEKVPGPARRVASPQPSREGISL